MLYGNNQMTKQPDYTPITKQTYKRNYADELADRIDRERYRRQVVKYSIDIKRKDEEL